MLRITHLNDSRASRLKLEGKILGPWTDELRTVCAEMANQIPLPHLDLTAVSFVDASGVELLDELRRKGFTLQGCSGYVAAVLSAERS
jgi:hypothetical protein